MICWIREIDLIDRTFGVNEVREKCSETDCFELINSISNVSEFEPRERGSRRADRW